ncbi:MAG: hypothetical protein QOG33_2702 [Gaiellales bacterium]|jgi:uncharacterized protein YcnI|nr:hypothetical protein [Gaiellales bacterium]
MRVCAPLIALAALLALPVTAQAHVQLTPDTVAPGENALFTIKSPNESPSQPLTGLRLTIPAELVVEGAADAPGFTTQVVRDQTRRVATLSWQGGSVPPGGLALFQFSASVPDTAGVIHLTATQTFADGSTKVWTSPVIAVATASSGSSDTTARLLAGLALALAAAAIAVALIGMRRRR